MRGKARQDEDRGHGIPLEDAERACRHYSITLDEYYECPECYLLPERGTGLSGINAVDWDQTVANAVIGTAALVIGLIVVTQWSRRTR
jgi:hypothetical protein